jgi:3-oxoacyl-[acyl-carrier protein] reductase
MAKTALVTGGSRGIGRGIVIALAQAGWNVTFSYHSARQAAEETIAACAGAGALVQAVAADTGQTADRQRLIEQALLQTGCIDLLVNNAGMAPRQRLDLLEMREDSFDEVLLTNLKGPFFLTVAVAKHMQTQTQRYPETTPIIINIGSLSAYTSSVNRGEYCLSKAGLGMMTALFADRLAADGILVYEVRPGIIETDMTAGVRAKYDALIAEGLLPIRRWGNSTDVARAVITLAQGALPYSTGEVINVDGGYHLRRL